MNSFHRTGVGWSSQLARKTTAKKMAKSVVGNSTGRSLSSVQVRNAVSPSERYHEDVWNGIRLAPARSLPFDRARRLRSEVVRHPVHPWNLGHDPAGDALQDIVGQSGP